MALGFRRLAIMDPSERGHQPMKSMRSRYFIVFNGEIYNADELRATLESSGGAFHFRGQSDTEVFLAAIEEWGIETALTRSSGMFAFALWDTWERKLTLGRDRFGEKPLYYGISNGTLLFGSELKGLTSHPAFDREIDRESVALYLRHGYVPDPRCIYRSLRKLTPGCTVTFSSRDIAAQVLPAAVSYWSTREAALRGRENPFRGSEKDAIDGLESIMRRTIAQQTRSDVPLGAFLSGGIDSSIIVAMMQSQNTRPAKTFSIGFHEQGFNEAEQAARVSRQLKTEHTELYITPSQAREVIPLLPWLYDEPFADSSQIPTYLVARLARQQVTVCLSGDGGDELFGGYSRYRRVDRLWKLAGWVPSPIRSAAGRLLQKFPGLTGSRRGTLARRVYSAAQALTQSRFAHVYRTSVSAWRTPLQVVLQGSDPQTEFDVSACDRFSGLRQMMLLDTLTYLPGDILTKVDRATMGVGLESRAPFLDREVAEFALSLPQNLLVRGKAGKWILRRLLDRYIPRAFVDRPKQGFGVPIDAWLRGPLRDWAADLLQPQTLRAQGFFDEETIHQVWELHLSRAQSSGTQLWSILMFQSWLAAQSPPAAFRSAA
jgi:asparagine synthase (glutamine-hydrolysing)